MLNSIYDIPIVVAVRGGKLISLYISDIETHQSESVRLPRGAISKRPDIRKTVWKKVL